MAKEKINTKNIVLDKILDASKLRCPAPILEAKRKIKELSQGQTLLIMTSEPSFNIDFAVLAQKTGNQILESWSEEQIYYNLLQKS